VAAGAVYVMAAGVIFSASNTAMTAGLAWTGPAGAAMKWNSTTVSTGYRPTLTSVDGYSGSTATRLAFLMGRLVTADTAGELTLTLATSDAAQTATLAADSWVLLTRVA